MANKIHFKKKWIFLILLILVSNLFSIIFLSSNLINTDDLNKKSNKNTNKPLSFIHPSASLPPNATDFTYYKVITINPAKVSGSGKHIDFPVLISILDSDLHNDIQSNGNDIAFSNGTDWLDHEIELFNQNYNGTYAQLVVWVRIPLLSTSTNTSIYMYYGNPTIGARQNPEGVWDNNFKFVSHMQNDPDFFHISDSTSNHNDGTKSGSNKPSETDAQIYKGQKFNSSNNENIRCDDDISLKITNNLTVAVWVKGDAQNTKGFLAKYDTSNQRSWQMRSPQSGDNDPQYNKFVIVLSDDGTYNFGHRKSYVSSMTILDDTWHYTAFTFASGTLKLYVDGIEDTNVFKRFDDSITTLHNSSADVSIGSLLASGSPSNCFDGKIDEARISNVNRSSGWIKTSYTNQNDPSSFYTISQEEKIDTIRPIIENVAKSADPIELGSNITITVDVYDNETSVSTVLIELEDANYTMRNIGGITYEFNWTGSCVGIVNYTIYANDEVDNWNNYTDNFSIIDTTLPSFSDLVESQEILELGNPEIISINTTDLSGINQVTIEFEGDNHSMTYINGDMWRYNSWTPNSVGNYSYTIWIEDNNNNWNSTSGSFKVVDTTPPAPPIITNAPSGDVSGVLIFDWLDGDDPSGISYYILIIDNETDPNITPGYIYEFNITNNYFELSGNFTQGKYYYFLSQIDGVGLQSNFTMGTFTVISVNDVNYDFIIFVIIGLIFASVVGSIATIIIVKRRIQKDILPRKKKIPLKIIISHINKISSSQLVFEKEKFQKEKTRKKTDKTLPEKELIDEKELEKQLNEYKTLGEELFAESAYLEAQKQFEHAEKLLLTLGREEEALVFSELTIGIMGLIEERERRLERLERAKLDSNSINIFDLYFDIIEISKKFKDTDAVNMYQSELIQLFQDDKLKLKDLEYQRFNLYKQANSQFIDNLFKKAAENFEKCEKISQFLVQIGRENEKNNVEKFREKIKDCLNKASQK